MHGEPLGTAPVPDDMALVGYLIPGLLAAGQGQETAEGHPQDPAGACKDLMTISVEAGLAFDGAMQRSRQVGQRTRPGIQEALGEMRVGKTKREALHELVQTTGVPDLSTFVASIVQADQLGVSICEGAEDQSEQMRIRRRQRAEEQAHKAADPDDDPDGLPDLPGDIYRAPRASGAEDAVGVWWLVMYDPAAGHRTDANVELCPFRALTSNI